MSWHGRKILTEEEAKQRSVSALPSTLQLGDPAKLWVADVNGNATAIPAVVTGMRFETGAIYYDLAFEVKGAPGYYVTVKDFRGYVSPVDVTTYEPDGGLVDVSDLKLSPPKPHLTVVK